MQQLSIEEDGEAVGELIALGDAFLFYTTIPALASLDGRRFASIAEARQAIDEILRRNAAESDTRLRVVNG